MYCPKCNKENPDDAQFCNSCGCVLTKADATSQKIYVRISRMAVVSFACTLCGLALLVPTFFAATRPRSLRARQEWIGFAFLIGIIALSAASVLGLLSVIRIERSGGKITGRAFAVGAVLIAIFGALLLPAWSIYKPRKRSVAFRMVCGSNLSRIGKAMLIYSNDYDDEFPRAGGKNSVWTAKIPDWKADNRFGAYNLNNDGSGGQASISSCFYLLVKYAEIKPKSFLCNGDPKTKEFKTAHYGVADRELIDLWDFGPEPWKHYSYSYHNPYGPYALTTSSEPGMAVAADRNPWIASPFVKAKRNFNKFNPDGGREIVNIGNAIAHNEDGQNVLFLDSHVSFEKRSFCGIKDDNIYTYWDGGDIRRGAPPKLGSQPAGRLDSLLVHDPPVKNQK